MISKTGFDPFSEPMVSSENGAGVDVWYSASAAAIFIGWYWVVNSLPWVSPVMITATAAMIAVIAPAFSACRKASAWLSAMPGRRICHSATPATSDPAVRKQPAMTCGKPASCAGLNSTAANESSSSWRVTGL